MVKKFKQFIYSMQEKGDMPVTYPLLMIEKRLFT